MENKRTILAELLGVEWYHLITWTDAEVDSELTRQLETVETI